MNIEVPYYQKDGIAIYHADSMDFLRALPDDCVDMIFTDPPYGHNNNNGDLIHRREAALGRTEDAQLPGAAARPIANDDPLSTRGLVFWAFCQFARVLKRDGACCCCCCGGGGPDPQFARWSLWLNEVLTFKQMIIWDKGPMGMGWHYRRSYETVLVAHKGKQCRWYDDSHKVENIIRDVRKIIPRATDHPSPKPIELAARFISYHSRPAHEILDPFMGGGSTLVAARLLNRSATGVELDERWCEMSARRLENCLDEYEIVNR